MFDPPRTLGEAKVYRYGDLGRGKCGDLYRDNRCAYAVWDKWNDHQCYRKKGHGPSGLYCKQHAKVLEKRKS